MKKNVSLLFCVFFSLVMFAQVQTPKPSPASKIEQQVGLTDVTIEYSRPSMKGREIFGKLIPFDQKWRTGANKNTTISFTDDVIIGEKRLPKGNYAIYTVPSEDEWKLIFYKDTNNWGVPEEWNDEKVALSTTMKVDDLPFEMETFTIVIDNLTNNSATINFLWENKNAYFDVNFLTQEKTMENIARAINGPSSEDYFNAGVYYFNEGQDLKQAQEWVDKAISMQNEPTFWMLRQKALIEAERGDKKRAIKTAEASIQAAEKSGNMQYVRMNQESIEKWSK